MSVFRRMGNGLRNFMMGRYGPDRLGTCLLVLGMVLMVSGSILGRFYLWAVWLRLLAWIPLGFCVFRMYSRNFTARSRENRAFLGFFTRLRDRKHCYFRCPGCRQRVRVPRGRGKISIKCPKCQQKFMKKT